MQNIALPGQLLPLAITDIIRWHNPSMLARLSGSDAATKTTDTTRDAK